MLVICMKRQALPDKLLPEWEEICATACSVQVRFNNLQNRFLFETDLKKKKLWLVYRN